MAGMPWSRNRRRAASESDRAAQRLSAAMHEQPDNSHSTSDQNKYGLRTVQESKDDIVDIILVHGLTEGPEKTWTWTGKGRTAFWPEFLSHDIPIARLAVFRYDADVAKITPFEKVSTNTINQHAKNLCASLGHMRERDGTIDRPIIFIAHSTGGLVCKDALLHSNSSQYGHIKKISDCTRAIAFLGTPHRGSDKADFAHLMAKLASLVKQTNVSIVDVLRPDSERLEKMQEEFYNMLGNRGNAGNKIGVTCFYEELPDPKLGKIVPYKSAIMPGFTSIGIHAYHSGLTKFENENSEGYKKILGELTRWMRELNSVVAEHVKAQFQRTPLALPLLSLTSRFLLSLALTRLPIERSEGGR